MQHLLGGEMQRRGLPCSVDPLNPFAAIRRNRSLANTHKTLENSLAFRNINISEVQRCFLSTPDLTIGTMYTHIGNRRI